MHCDPRFSRVREVFERHFADGEELGAAFAVYLNGELVVDLWGGVADRHTGRRWERDTPAFAYSCTKAITATVLLQLAERGLVDVSAPVAEVWPEFAARGKGAITVEQVLTHQCGLPVIEDPVPVEEFEDQAAIAARLAGQAPIWEPGAAHGYHALTYGFLLGEVIRRVTGKSVGELVAAEIAGPLGLELWVGAPDDVIARTARLKAGERPQPLTVTEAPATAPASADLTTAAAQSAPVPGPATTPGTPATGGTARAEGAAGTGDEAAQVGHSATPDSATSDSGGVTADGETAAPAGARGGRPAGGGQSGDLLAEMAKAALDPQSLMNRALGNPGMHLLKGGANHPTILRAGWPAAGMVTTARDLAGFYRALIAGDILSPATLRDAMRTRVDGPDRVLYLDTAFGLGYMRPSITFLMPSRSAFGHSGLGGSIGLGDQERGLAMAYVMNKMANAVSGNLRGMRLVRAVYDSL
ncbi:serine hydrolase domain-containing protein [Nonomuraea sp. SYSU D8015]|uniref:serine hydrolase domain-containing protein n=1 Tax=Nonomuraea sp. SYSU D8015 TaxID=2593644 RepID=UPI001660F988|nr:serine hydrolase domain-containing protein [Nonomuraea sp. SYSU D8015]